MRRLALPALAAVAAATAPAAAAAPARSAPPALRAVAAVLVEPTTGDVVYRRNAHARRPIASTTKLMTALITLERAALSDVFTAVPYRAAAAESVIGLRAGERLTVSDLLRGLLLPSANDAAATLAVGVSGSQARFVRDMNRRARELGLRDTHYANPIGLDARGNYSSAADLVRLAIELRRRPFFARTVDRPRAILRTGARRRVVVSRNRLLRAAAEVNGVKTGHTGGAGYVLVGSATRGGVTMVSAVLGEPSEAARDADTLALLRYGLARYRRVTAVRAGRVLAHARIRFRGDARVGLVAARSLDRVVRRGERVAVTVDAPAEVEGPLRAGERVGTVLVRARGRVAARIPLVTAAAVPEAGLGQRLRDYFGRPLTVLLVITVLGCSLQLGLLRRRALRRRRIPVDHGTNTGTA